MPCESRFEDDGRKIVNFESALPDFVNFESLIVNFESRGASAMVTFGSYRFAPTNVMLVASGKCNSTSQYFIFQSLERTFQTLKRTFQTLKHTFQSVERMFP